MSKKIKSNKNHSKKVSQVLGSSDKKVISLTNNTDKEHPIWSFERADNDGEFRFSSETVDNKMVIEKILDISRMTWAEICQATHDRGKTKNHFLSDFSKFSKQAQERVRKILDETEYDTIFSLALTNVIRLIGLRKERIFYVIWYDSEHNFYPSKK